MKVLTLLLFLGFHSSIDEQGYKLFFSTEIKEARIFINQHSSNIKKYCSVYGHSEHICMAIVYPELLRYSSWKDLLESTAMEHAYVRWGKDVVDFSIGRFQMKASFAEFVESEIKTHELLFKKYQNIVSYTHKTDEGVRKQRVAKLKSTVWQILYINAFYDLCLITYPELKLKPESELVFALASIYNRGFKHNLNQIIESGYQKQFPYGPNYPGKQFSYGEISTDYYSIKTKAKT